MFKNDAIWQYLSKRNEWRRLGVDVSNSIEDAFSTGARQTSVQRPQGIYHVDICMSEMVKDGVEITEGLTIKIQRSTNRESPTDIIW